MNELVVKAKEYAVKCHADVNHLYDKKPYKHHLLHVYATALRFIHLIPEDDRSIVLAACWAHDVIEDTRQTYNDVKKQLGETVAEIVYALTNEKGKDRKERANAKYYAGIRSIPGAAFVKVCDRIANYEYSKSVNSSMATKYELEMINFWNELYVENYREMWGGLMENITLDKFTEK